MSGKGFKNRIVHPDLAKRFQQACEGNPDVPMFNHGRLNWFVDKLKEFDIEVHLETVRKWFAGETHPRPKPMMALARILQVDETWLANGTSPEFSNRERKLNNLVAGGSVNLVAGFIQVDGGHPAFPTEDDADAKNRQINLYAVIRGAKYSFHITPAVESQDSKFFVVPHDAQGTLVLGVIKDEGFVVRIYELDWEVIADMGTRKGSGYNVPVEGLPHREIKSFAERI